jgi:hypothetical protein
VNIVALGDHLRADEQVDLAGVEACEQAFEIGSATNRVAVHAADARVGKYLAQPFFALLRSRAKIVKMLARALGAAGGHGAPVAAVVAFEALARVGNACVFCRRLVVGERDGAILALQLFSAGAADDGEGVAAAVEQDERLLAPVQGSLRLLHKRPREELLLPRLLEFAPHIDNLDFGQRAVHDAVAHLDARVFALRGVLPAFQRRRGRAQHHHRAFQLGPHHGHVAGVVARRLLLLVTLVVLLIHQDQTQIGRGGKDGRAGADDDGRVSAANAPPLVAALLRRERGMEQRDFLAEGLVEQAYRLRREADLGNQQDGRETAVERALHGGKVDGRFA